MIIFLIRKLAWTAALPYVAVVLLVLTGPPTWSAVAYLAGIGLLLTGLVTLRSSSFPRGGDKDEKEKEHRVFGIRRPRGLTRGALLSLVAIAVVRGCSGREGETLHFAPDARIVDRLFDEQDVAVSGTRVLVVGGMLHDDADELPSAMRAAYAKMRTSEGDAPSPVLATYLGMQSASSFDLLVIENTTPKAPKAPEQNVEPNDAAVIFLHGFAGNFALPCWQMAHAVSSLGYTTVCPSTRWIGDWWTPEGESILRHTVDTLHARGISRIVLAGLSNGGIGASRLVARMHGSFAGLILISGEDPHAKNGGIPTLVIHGKHDSMTPYSFAREYAEKNGARLVTIDRGHFAMLVRAEESDRAVREFLVALDHARHSS